MSNKTNLVIELWPMTGGYQWLVPRPDNLITYARMSSDIGTAVREAHAKALEMYAGELGTVNFRLNPGQSCPTKPFWRSESCTH